MVASYGPGVADQPRFLSEYRRNLDLFQSIGPTASVVELADLLSRPVLPASLDRGFAGYDPRNVELVRRYAESALSELQAYYKRDGNPVFVWQAVNAARGYSVEWPDWVYDYLLDAADRIMEIKQEVAERQPARREAERVGKALGFGVEGPGQGGRFKQASMLDRDRDIYFRVHEWMEAERKRYPKREPNLSGAYDAVKDQLGLDRSTIQRGYARIRDLQAGLRGAKDDGSGA
jgi:hypothetical protein